MRPSFQEAHRALIGANVCPEGFFRTDTAFGFLLGRSLFRRALKVTVMAPSSLPKEAPLFYEPVVLRIV
jgi:hypothetical protein